MDRIGGGECARALRREGEGDGAGTSVGLDDAAVVRHLGEVNRIRQRSGAEID